MVGSHQSIFFILQIGFRTIILIAFKCRSTLLHPVEVSIFWRSRFHSDGSGTVLPGMPVHLYARVKEVGMN